MHFGWVFKVLTCTRVSSSNSLPAREKLATLEPATDLPKVRAPESLMKFNFNPNLASVLFSARALDTAFAPF